MESTIEILQSYYSGFSIDEAVGNNAFSFDQRTQKSIFVPSLIEGSLDNLAVGEETVFSEFFEGEELNKTGLKHFVYLKSNDRHIFIFDNHNHAFFFWCYGLKAGLIQTGDQLVHVDQHKDTRAPKRFLSSEQFKNIDLKEVFEYTNYELNVGDFIQPALTAGLFSEVIHVNSKAAFGQFLPARFTLDIDIDIFADEMNYIDEEFKIKKIRNYIDRSQFITIATSPYFIDQSKAVETTRRLLEPLPKI